MVMDLCIVICFVCVCLSVVCLQRHISTDWGQKEFKHGPSFFWVMADVENEDVLFLRNETGLVLFVSLDQVLV